MCGETTGGFGRSWGTDMTGNTVYGVLEELIKKNLTDNKERKFQIH